MKTVDINVDMGESFGIFRHGDDEKIMPYITSANIACGFHAGDPTVMRKTVQQAVKHGVAIGGHVGYSDILGFGRRQMEIAASDLKNYTIYQLGALNAFARAENSRIHHVKLHGALYMKSLDDAELAEAIVQSLLEFDKDCLIYTVGNSALAEKAKNAGIKIVPEFFADRGYYATGQIKMFNWSITEAGGTIEKIARRAVRAVMKHEVDALNGSRISINAKTICVHSDTPNSVKIVSAIRQALARAGIVLKAPSKIDSKKSRK
jgi:UPF0271 protein